MTRPSIRRTLLVRIYGSRFTWAGFSRNATPRFLKCEQACGFSERRAEGFGGGGRGPVRRAAAGAGAGGVGGDARADRGGEERGQARLVRRHGPAGVRAGGARLRGQVFRHRRPHRAHRLGAAVRAAGAGIRQQHPRARRDQRLRRLALRRLEAQRLARRLRAGGRGAALCARTPRSGRALCHLAGLCQLARLQLQLGEGGGRAAELHGSSQSQMARQDRQGASRL